MFQKPAIPIRAITLEKRPTVSGGTSRNTLISILKNTLKPQSISTEGISRAKYGQQVNKNLSGKLLNEFGRDFLVTH